MSLYDEFFTNDDKPFAENLNDALLLSNVFDLTVGVEYPTMCSSAYWGYEESVKKCSVSIVKIVDYDGVSYNSSGITGTGTVKVNFYPNFNAFGKITAIEWTNAEGITCDVYSEGGQLIQANIPNGTITTQSAGFSVLQNFQLRFHLDDATLSKFKVTMSNREDLRYGATVGITNVTGLQTALDGKAPNEHSSTETTYGVATTTKYGHVQVDDSLSSSSTNPVQNTVINTALNGKASTTNNTTWTDLSSYVNTNYFSVTNCKGMIRNGFAIINLFLTFKTTSGTPSVLKVYDLKFKPKGNVSYLPVTANYTRNRVEAGVIHISYNGGNYFECDLEMNSDNIVANASQLHGLLIYPIDDY